MTLRLMLVKTFQSDTELVHRSRSSLDHQIYPEVLSPSYNSSWRQFPRIWICVEAITFTTYPSVRSSIVKRLVLPSFPIPCKYLVYALLPCLHCSTPLLESEPQQGRRQSKRLPKSVSVSFLGFGFLLSLDMVS